MKKKLSESFDVPAGCWYTIDIEIVIQKFGTSCVILITIVRLTVDDFQ